MPFNGVSVTDPAYGAIDDGRNGYFYATWKTRQTSLTAYTAELAVTVANSGPNGVAQVTMPGSTAGLQLGPQQSWVGKPIAIDGAGEAGATLVSRVANFFYDATNQFAATAVLTSAAPTPLTASVRKLACPCFTSGSDGSLMPSDAGKKLFIGSGGHVTNRANATLTFVPITVPIIAVVSPFEVTTAIITADGVTAQPGTLMEWGTDNTAAVTAAGRAALAAGATQLLFPGLTSAHSTGRFCCFDFASNSSNTGSTVADFDNVILVASLEWITSNATTFITWQADGTGVTTWQSNSLWKQGIPWNAPAPPAPRKSFDASTQLPRCATLSRIVILICGDSWGNLDPTGCSNPAWGPFIQNFIRQNQPHKQVYVVPSAINGLTWNALRGTIDGLRKVPVAGLGVVTPDLVFLAITGGNDRSQIARSDIQTVINTVKGWDAVNGLPPDVMMITGTWPRQMAAFASNNDIGSCNFEYTGVLQRSIARKNGIPFLDYARQGAFALRGWSEDSLVIKRVPALDSGTAGPTAPYVIPYLCRDGLFVFQLGTSDQSGSSFWPTAGWLALQLSAKPDNRAYVYPDNNDNLAVIGVTWGMTVPTTITMTSGSAGLATSGQTNFGVVGHVWPGAPDYGMGWIGANFTPGIVGQCFWAQSCYYGSLYDFRSYFMGYTHDHIIQLCDSNSGGAFNTVAVPSAAAWGGQMFIASDATGGLSGSGVDVVVGGAGTATHPFTGENSLITTVAGYSTHQYVTLAAVNAQATIAASVENVFVGLIHQHSAYDYAVPAGSDKGLQPCLAFRLQGTHLKISYLLGAGSLSSIRQSLQRNERLVWQGEIERFGGPFIPKLYAKATVTVKCVYAWIDDFEANLFQPRMTMMEAFGSADRVGEPFSYPYGGDTTHPSHKYLQVLDDASSTQNLASPLNFGATFETCAPTTDFSYTIPNNQALTHFDPAGPLTAGTVGLPAVFPQGGRLEIFSSQAIRSLTIGAPSGFSLQGNTVTGIDANGTIAYRLIGTTFLRVQ